MEEIVVKSSSAVEVRTSLHATTAQMSGTHGLDEVPEA